MMYIIQQNEHIPNDLSQLEEGRMGGDKYLYYIGTVLIPDKLDVQNATMSS